MAGFRTIVIQSPCKITYKDGFMVIRGDVLRTVHISEIHTLIIESTMVTLTGYLLCELVKAKTAVLFCDEKRNPISQMIPFYGSHDSAGRLQKQAEWRADKKQFLWQYIIRQKILNQSMLLQKVDPNASAQLAGFANQVEPGDVTNREGHSAKVYFNRIFGPGFSRSMACDRNAALNYGYSLILSCFNREIAAHGYATQLGIHHCNHYNPFNLSSDLMEPFRFLVDRTVFGHADIPFDKAYKRELQRILNMEVLYNHQRVYLTTAIQRYVRNAIDFLDGEIDFSEDVLFHYEDAYHESNRDV